VINKSKNIILVAFLFIIIVSFSGCTNKKSVEDTDTSSGGIAGISSEFMSGGPPDQISEDEPFTVSVKIDNNGEYLVQQDEVVVYLLGVNPASIGLKSDETMLNSENCGDCLISSEPLLPSYYINGEWIPGGYDYITWPTPDSDAEYLGYNVNITSDQNLNFVAQTCYNYETVASADACFSDNAYAQTTGAETCDIAGEKYVSNSGAPIHITKVVENPAGKERYSFTFHIENVGEGRAFAIDWPLNKCTNIPQASLDRVFVKDVRVGGVTPELSSRCTDKSVFLVDGKGQFTCTVKPTTVVGDYTDIVEVVLRYGYYSQTDKQIVVKNIFDELDNVYLKETICNDELDTEDNDGKTDCLDKDCNGEVGEPGGTGLCEFGTELNCTDSFDNDGDGLIDALDTEDCI